LKIGFSGGFSSYLMNHARQYKDLYKELFPDGIAAEKDYHEQLKKEKKAKIAREKKKRRKERQALMKKLPAPIPEALIKTSQGTIEVIKDPEEIEETKPIEVLPIKPPSL